MRSPETSDTFPRVSARDLLFTLMHVVRGSATLETLREAFCADRGAVRGGDYLWSAARDSASELQRLALASGVPYPRDARTYRRMCDQQLDATEAGRALADRFQADRASAYDTLLSTMHRGHSYLRGFLRVLRERDLLAPVATSLKEHVSPRYASAAALVEDLAASRVDADSVCHLTAQRIGRDLSDAENREIVDGLMRIPDALSPPPDCDPAEVSRKFLLKLNEVVVPAVLRGDGLGFDFRTHRALWSLGEEFKAWCATSSHPAYDGWLVFRTATIHGAPDAELSVTFDTGLEGTRPAFLAKLWAAYQRTSRLQRTVHVSAAALRSVFCHENHCQRSVFNHLFEEYSSERGEYEVHLEIQQQKLQYEPPLRAGGRNVGLVRVVRVGGSAREAAT